MRGLISSPLFNHPFFRDPFELIDSPLRKMAQMDISSDLNYDIYKEGDKFVALFNMPGHTGMDDIKADVDKETRILKVESKKVNEDKKEVEGRVYYHRGESKRCYQIRLPEDLNLDSVSAKCENGQLKVSFDVKTLDEIEGKNKLSIDIQVVENKA